MDFFIYIEAHYVCFTVFVTAWDGDTTPDTGFSDEWEPVSCATTDCPENKVCNDDLGFVSCVCKEGMAGKLKLDMFLLYFTCYSVRLEK